MAIPLTTNTDVISMSTTFREGNVIADDLPVPAPGNTYVFLDRQSHMFNTTIRNDGVMPFSAVMQIVLTNASNTPSTIEHWSNTVTMEPGSIFSPSQGEVLTGQFSAASAHRSLEHVCQSGPERLPYF